MHLRAKPLDEIYYETKVPSQGKPMSPLQAMGLAWSLALKGSGFVQSNPLVGAVCLDQNQNFLGAGYHSGFGKAHAEQALITNICQQGFESKLNQASIYVTLEPCAHVGKTPSCADLLSQFPLKKVIYGLADPTEKTSGQGPKLSRQAGVQTEVFPACSEVKSKLELLVEPFVSFEQKKQVFVAAKIASSLNGVFTYSGASRFWLTSKRARSYGHWLRLFYDAIAVGAETVIQDNPSLNIRSPKKNRTPLRVVIDPEARALRFRPIEESNLLKTETNQTLWCLKQKSWEGLCFKSRNSLEKMGLRTLFLKESLNENIFEEILAFLFSQGIASLLIEGGAGVWASAFNRNKVNKLHLFQAPKVFCQEQTMNWSSGLTRKCFDLQKTSLTRLQEDLLIEGYTTVESHSL